MLVLILAIALLILIVWGALVSRTFRIAAVIVAATPVAAFVLVIFWMEVAIRLGVHP